MKTDDEKDIFRTAGDTDPILVQIRRITAAGVVAITDSSVVTMNIKNILAITGTAKGDGSGTFLFDVAGLPVSPQTLDYNIQVTESGQIATYGKGRIFIESPY